MTTTFHLNRLEVVTCALLVLCLVGAIFAHDVGVIAATATAVYFWACWTHERHKPRRIQQVVTVLVPSDEHVDEFELANRLGDVLRGPGYLR